MVNLFRGSEVFTVLDGGNVGIKVTNPNHDLTIAGNMSASVNVSASAFYGSGVSLTGVTIALKSCCACAG